MPSFNAEVPHNLGKEVAIEKLHSFLTGVAEKYKDQVSKLDGQWSENILDFSLTTYGFSITGKLTVEEEVALLDGQLPFAAVAFRGKIQKGIASELARALSAGEDQADAGELSEENVEEAGGDASDEPPDEVGGDASTENEKSGGDDEPAA